MEGEGTNGGGEKVSQSGGGDSGISLAGASDVLTDGDGPGKGKGGDPGKEKVTTIQEVVITVYKPLPRISIPEPTFKDYLQNFRNSSIPILTPNFTNIKPAIDDVLDLGNAIKNFIGIGRYKFGFAGEQWSNIDGSPMGAMQQQDTAVNLMVTMGGIMLGGLLNETIVQNTSKSSINRLNHIFNKPEHSLNDLVQQFGSEQKAFWKKRTKALGKPRPVILKSSPIIRLKTAMDAQLEAFATVPKKTEASNGTIIWKITKRKYENF